MFLLQKIFPFRENNAELVLDKPNPKLEAIKKSIYQYLLNKKTIVLVGFYAYNYFCTKTEYEPVPIPFYEFISVNYCVDAQDLIDKLKLETPTLNYKEYYPFYQFTDYSTRIYIDDDLICCIYNHNKRCIPYQDVSAINFHDDKNTEDNIRIGSFTTILLYLLINAQQQHINKNIELKNLYFQMFSHCIQMRNEYLAKKKKNFLDETIFREFILDCVGEEITAEKEFRIRIEHRKQKKKPLIFRYNPSDAYIETPPKYIFSNSSGNTVNNPRDLKLYNNNTSCEEVDEEENIAENKKDEINEINENSI